MHRRLGRWLRWWLIALLVLLAILLSALRLGVGQVTEYRQQAERMLSDYLGQPVRIAGLDARMIGFSPSLVLDQFSLLDDDRVLAEFEHLALSLDLPASLWNLRPVTRVLLSGANIVVQRLPDGRITLQGLKQAQSPAAHREGGDALLQWLFGMPRLHIQNSRILWQDQLTKEQWQFEQLALLLDNQPGSHRFKGSMTLPEQMGQGIKLAVELKGDPLLPASWAIDFYLQIQALHTTARARRYHYAGWELERALLDLELWGKWQHRQLEQLDGQLQLQDLQLRSETQGPLAFPHLSSQLHYRRSDTGHSLQLDRFKLGRNSKPMQLALGQQDTHWKIQGNALQLAELSALLPLWPKLDDKQRDMIRSIQPQGEIGQLYLAIEDGKLHTASAIAQNLSLQAWQKLPAVHGLDGRIDMQQQRLRLQLDSPSLQLHLPTLFSKPLPPAHARGDLLLQQEADGWRLFGREVQISNADIQLQAQLQILFDASSAPLVSLQGEFRQAMATAIPHYLPDRVMPDATTRWLQQAFVTGTADAGRLSLHGRMNEFPFREGQGRFEAVLDATNVDLNYSPDWPLLQDASGEVHFDGPGLSIHGRHGQMLVGQIGQTEVRLEDFRHPILQLEGSASAGAADGLRFLHQSPLGKHLSAIKDFEAGGDTRIELDLALPLAKRLHGQGHIRGRIHLHDSRLRVHPDVSLEQINGVLNFDGTRFQARSIEAHLYRQPLRIDVVNRAGVEAETVLIAHGQLDPADLQEHWPYPWLKQIRGQTPWQGQLRIPHTGQGHSWLYLSTPGSGLVSTLPQPLAKKSGEYLPLEVQLNFGTETGHTLRLGDRLAAHWQQGGRDKALQRASLHLGDRTIPALPDQDSLLISGRLAGLHLPDWQALFSDAKTSTATTLPLNIRMQRLHLTRETDVNAQKGNHADWLLKQAISVTIEDFRYQDMTLGNTRVRLEPQNGQLQITGLQIDSETLSVNGSGSWQPRRGTQLSLDYRSDDTGEMLRSLGFASVIRKGKLKGDATLQWPGSPQDFSLSSLRGDLKLRIDDGIIDEARPGAGKLLGILSLQALPRRLFLDFRDVAEEGLHFNRLRAELKLADGNAHTSELSIDSHPAQILISGRTGLIARDFDQEMIVVPKVSDTVSVAGALTMGPQVGAILLVLQKIFKRDIDAATMRQYHIGGSWEKPELTWLNPPEKEETTDETTPW